MMPLVRPAPLSAWMLDGLSDAYPQPSAINCSAAGGSLAAGGAKPPPPGPPRPTGGGSPGRLRPPPNMIMTGTGPFASAGVTNVIWMSTAIDGDLVLST